MYVNNASVDVDTLSTDINSEVGMYFFYFLNGEVSMYFINTKYH